MARGKSKAVFIVSHLAPLVLLSCGSMGESTFEGTGVERSERQTLALTSPGAIGSLCGADSDCPASMQCTNTKSCLCRPGFLACGKQCFDVATDTNHCGACGLACGSGERCQDGACVGSASSVAPFSNTAPFEIDGAQSTTTCYEAAEAYPELSANDGTTIDLPYQSQSAPEFPYNWTTQSSENSPFGSVPVIGGVASSDQWATTSAHTGLEYVSRILQPNGTTTTCVGIAATTPAHLKAGTWDFPLQCATANLAGTADGPSINYDSGGTNLFAVNNHISGGTGSILLDIFQNCSAGQPSGSSCPRTTSSLCVDGSCSGGAVFSHATVTVNPCTHDAIVAWRGTGSNVYLAFYNSSGSQVGSKFLVETAPFVPTNACTCGGDVERCGSFCASGGDCGETTGCARLASKVHVATGRNTAGNACYAYVAYDSNCAADTKRNSMRSHLSIIDVTNESAPSLVKFWVSSAPYNKPGDCYDLRTLATTNDFGGIVTASATKPGNVGWFFYRQSLTGNPCSTRFVGLTDTNSGLVTFRLSNLDGPFPTMRFNAADGMGDYIGIVKNGLPGGVLFPTWARPVTTSASCVSCQGAQESLAIFGSAVTP